MNVIRKNILLFAILLLASCSATYTAVSKKDLVVQSKMNKSIFLDPVSPSKRIVYVEVRNTSDTPDFDVSDQVRTSIAAKGYKVTDDPEEANFLLQANILSIIYDGESSGSSAGSALSGALVGGGVGAVSSGNKGAIAGALVGGLASTIADAAVKDITFTVVTDILLSQKKPNFKKSAYKKSSYKRDYEKESYLRNKKKKTKKRDSMDRRYYDEDDDEEEPDRYEINKRVDDYDDLGFEDDFSSDDEEEDDNDGWKRHKARIVSTANKVNLKKEDALPALKKGIANGISGVF